VTGDGSGSGSAITAFDATQLVAGNAYACMLGGSDGHELRCWGHHEVGELGLGSGEPDVVPLATVVPGAWQQVSAGLHHACAIDTSGKLFCWGNNTSNEVVPKGGAGAIFAPVEVDAVGSPAWKQVAAGGSHTCAIAVAGQLLCWGNTNVLGIEDATGFASFAVPGSAPTASPDWERVAASRDDVCAVSTSRGVFCFGAENELGQLGSGSLGSTTMVPPTPVAFPPPISALAMGPNNTCAIADGALECIGDNSGGTIDPAVRSSTPEPVTTPTPVLGSASPATQWTAVSLGSRYACAISNTAELYCWGTAVYGGLGDGNYFSVPSTAADLGSNATLIAVGDYTDVTYPETNHVDLIDLELTCATVGGRNTCWGDDRFGELGNGRATIARVPVQAASDVAELAVGQAHVCTRGMDGSVACWGNNSSGAVGTSDADCVGANQCSASAPMPVALPDADTASDLVSGWGHTCARGATSQTLTCWGDNGVGQANPDGALYSLGGLFASANATCALPVGFDVPTCFGALYVPTVSAYPTPIGATSFTEFAGMTEMSLGADFGCIEQAGNRWCVGDDSHGQYGAGGLGGGGSDELQLVDGMFPVVRASVTGEFGCGLGSADGVACWGQNTIGQLGTGKAGTDLGLPQQIDSDVCEALAVGAEHGCAICNGQPVCWGRNQFGQLGLGTVDIASPHAVALVAATLDDMSPWVDVQAGSKFTCGLRADHTVWCWGLGVSGELANGAKSADTPLQGGVDLAP
jgi:alpha-tubulin suppressor-like RCC1 family protein